MTTTFDGLVEKQLAEIDEQKAVEQKIDFQKYEK